MSSSENSEAEEVPFIFDMVGESVGKAFKESTEQLEAAILNFFGSEENFKKIGHLYTLETFQSPIKYEPGDGLTVRYKIEIKYRIRLKTKEELAADG